jgi:hypothetical protein
MIHHRHAGGLSLMQVLLSSRSRPRKLERFDGDAGGTRHVHTPTHASRGARNTEILVHAWQGQQSTTCFPETRYFPEFPFQKLRQLPRCLPRHRKIKTLSFAVPVLTPAGKGPAGTRRNLRFQLTPEQARRERRVVRSRAYDLRVHHARAMSMCTYQLIP